MEPEYNVAVNGARSASAAGNWNGVGEMLLAPAPELRAAGADLPHLPPTTPRIKAAISYVTAPRCRGCTAESVTLARALYERSRLTAFRLNWSLAELCREALTEWLHRHEPKVTGRRPER